MDSNEEMLELIASPGQVLCSALPYVYILMHKESGKLCDCCLKFHRQLLKCSACQISWYCNRSCQKKDWTFHKEECKGHQRIAPYIAKDSTRLMLRLIIRSKWSNDAERNAEAFGQIRSFEDLMSHKENIRSDPERCEEFLQLCLSLKAFVGEDFVLPEADQLLEFYGKICINTFSICDREMRPIGAGLYLGPSVLDHSCQPNAVVVFDGVCLNVNCIEPVYEKQKVTISYIDVLDTTSARRESLERSYYFQCQCTLCLDDAKDSMMQSSLCLDKTCSGVVLPNKDGVSLSCMTCGQLENDGDYFQTKVNAVKKSHEVLQALKELKSGKKFEELWQLSEECIDDVKNIFHPFNIQFIKLLDVAFDGCIEVSRFDKALEYGIKLLQPYRYFLPKYHPTLGIHLMKVGKIQLFLEHASAAMHTLQQAKAIIKVTHGSSHPLYAELQELMDRF